MYVDVVSSSLGGHEHMSAKKYVKMYLSKKKPRWIADDAGEENLGNKSLKE